MLKKYSFILRNLDCANCAREIEEGLKENKELKNVIVNFNTLRLSYETDTVSKDDVIKKVLEIEPEVNVQEINQDDGYEEESSKGEILRLLIGAIITGIGLYLEKVNGINVISVIITLFGYGVLLFKTIKIALKTLFNNHSVNENFLVSLACLGAFCIGQHLEGFMVIILYEIGELLEDKAVNKTRKSISDLMDIKPKFANLKTENGVEKVEPDDVKIGDTIVVKKGEEIPLDGEIVSGSGSLNVSSLTGESRLKNVKVGDSVLSGSINEEGLLEILVKEEFKNSTVQKILDLVENATDKKAKTETFVSKAAGIYTPIVIVLAVLVAALLPICAGISVKDSLYRALAFLVISCPCAIAISVPLSYFSGIGKASKEGILIKGSDYIDSLTKLKEVVFDKTGTLTKGEFTIKEIKQLKNYTKDEILEYAVIGESFSNHPIAKSIIKNAKEIDTSKASNFKEESGKGISYEIDGKTVSIGNSEFVGAEEAKEQTTNIFVKLDNEVIGVICLEDSIKEGVKEGLEKLKKLGIKTKMFTGDNFEAAKNVADELGINSVKAEMLPTDKYSEMEKLINERNEKSQIAFVGDGINDSPVLALADVGFAMGGVGANSAIEASDIVIMTDNIEKIAQSIKISKKTFRIIKENLSFAIIVKILVLVLSTLGILGMASAVFADVGVTLITIFNTLRILK